MNLDRITKSLASVESSLKVIAELLKEQEDTLGKEDEEALKQQTPLMNEGKDFEVGF